MTAITGTGYGTTTFDNAVVKKYLDVGTAVMAANGTTVVAQRIDLAVANATGGGVAGTHTGQVTVPAGAVILDIVVHAIALWNAGTSATLIVGDASDDDDGYYTAVNVKATDLLVGESLSFSNTGGKQGAYFVSGTEPASHWEARYNASARTMQAKVTLVGTTATTGRTLIDIFYFVPSSLQTVLGTYVAT